jgi:mercuric ion transport protein
MDSRFKTSGAVALAAGGIGAAFALAACCAIPIILAGFGLTAYWLAPVAAWGEWLGDCLTVASLVGLAGAIFIVIRAPKTCAPGALCARPWFRVTILVSAAIGAILLVLSKVYV